MVTLINLFCCSKKVFIPMKTWIAGKDLTKHHYRIKKLSELNLEDITEEDYAYGQKVWKKCVIKNLGEYHDLYVQSDTFLLADVFESFRNKCIEIYELNAANFLSAPGLIWQACLKRLK